MAIQPGVGAAQGWSSEELGGQTTQQVTNTTVGNAVAPVVNSNPERVGLVFINTGLNSIFLGIDSSVSATQGINLVPSGGSVTMNVRDDFTLVASPWFATTGGAGNVTICVFEVIRITLNPGQPS